MRRIIERVVTVVTTTTWTITWQDDTLHASRNPQTGSDTDNVSKPEVISVIEIKEADSPELKTEPDPAADEPPQNPDSY